MRKKRKFKEDEIGYLIEKRKQLKTNPRTDNNKQAIYEIEENIIQKTEDNYAERVLEALGTITGEDGKICHMGAWRQLSKINPNKKKQILFPTAFKDKFGNLITNKENIKNHCLTDILKRLRKRPVHPEIVVLKQRKLLL